MKDYYYILGLDRNASSEEIKKAHRKLSKKFHPDLNPNDSHSERMFKDIQEAYDCLISPEKRKQYDYSYSSWTNDRQNTSSQFEQQRSTETKQEPVVKPPTNKGVKIMALLLVAFLGFIFAKWLEPSSTESTAQSTKVTVDSSAVLDSEDKATESPVIVSVPKRSSFSKACTYCFGTGMRNCHSCDGSGKEKCSKCNGNGKYNAYFPQELENGYQYLSYDGHTEYVWVYANHYADFPCEACGKTGKVLCNTCDGSGKIRCSICAGTGQIKENIPSETANRTPDYSSIDGAFPQASQRLLSASELSGMSKQDLKIMRNEIYARHGYIFKTPEMKSYFSSQSWYRGIHEDVSSMLSDTEKKNVALIRSYE